MVASSEVVGSSEMSTCGLQDSAMAPHDMLFHLAAHLVRIIRHATLRAAHPDLRQRVNGAEGGGLDDSYHWHAPEGLRNVFHGTPDDEKSCLLKGP